IGIVALVVAYAGNTHHFMAGPLSTKHGSLGECSDCHSNVSQGPLGWLHSAITASNPRKDAENCQACHKMGRAGLNPHGIELARLEAYSKRLEATPAASKLPAMARMRSALFPVENARSEGVFCATCHQEHQGQHAALTSVSDQRCQGCHTVYFSSFHTDHPPFENYPFRRRTRINFDHSGHFAKHFPEWRKKNAVSSAVPGGCADCHTPGSDKKHMSVKKFDQVCAACHLDQIVGKERAIGPKGIALFALPGLDVETLKEKKANIGEWPETSEAEITPVMKLLIGRDAERRKLLETVGGLDLLDLTQATDSQIAQVASLAWEIKYLLFALTTTRTSEIFSRLGPATGTRISADLTARLTANMPRDVLMAAQREWLPGLAGEIDQRKYGEWITSISPVVTVAEASTPDQPETADAKKPVSNDPDAIADGAAGDVNARPRNDIFAEDPRNWRVDALGRLIKGTAPQDSEADTDDVPADDPSAAVPAAAVAQTPTPVAGPAVNAESWAEFGGWYRQDFAILYKPTGHADMFLRAWLEFTAGLYNKSGPNPATPVFMQLTADDAQGQCAKCHSIDAKADQSRTMNWMPSTPDTRESAFTTFSHEPHFGLVDEKGCLTCHALSNAKGYLKTYKGTNPYSYVSNFTAVKKDTCASCHGGKQAREDCLLCHKYHVQGVVTPITATKIPERQATK
ncbi:MAG: cytochrome c3 family protein, partial [Hyphomicrobiales bacterium]|nr:cytochrome c3 family protein [Hyphomicrobiales bacterium]